MTDDEIRGVLNQEVNERGMTKSSLGRLVDMPVSSVSDVLNGRVGVVNSNVRKILDALEYTLVVQRKDE